MIMQDITNSKAYYDRGIAYYKKHEYDKAIVEFSEVIKHHPNHVKAYYNRGNGYPGRFSLSFTDSGPQVGIRIYLLQKS